MLRYRVQPTASCRALLSTGRASALAMTWVWFLYFERVQERNYESKISDWQQKLPITCVYSSTFEVFLDLWLPWTRPSVHSPVYQWNNCTSNITRILTTILTRQYFDSTRFACMRFSLSFSHALLELKCDMQISYEMVSNGHVHQLTVSL